MGEGESERPRYRPREAFRLRPSQEVAAANENAQTALDRPKFTDATDRDGVPHALVMGLDSEDDGSAEAEDAGTTLRPLSRIEAFLLGGFVCLALVAGLASGFWLAGGTL